MKPPASTTRRAAMRRLALAALLPLAAPVAPAAANGEDPIAEHLWISRPLVIFADAERDPRLVRQLREIESVRTELDLRDVVVIVDTTPGPSRFETTPLRKKFRPHGFNVLLIGKDGQVKLRRPSVVSGPQLTRMIDRLPLRQQEMGRR